MRGLTIAGGRSRNAWGAGLSVLGETSPAALTLEGVVVTDNVANNAGGGGIYASNATLTLTDTLVTGNAATNSASNAALGGGGLFVDDYYGTADVTLIASTVGGNEATGGNLGGGIKVIERAAARAARVTLEHSTVGGNKAGAGAGISNEGGAVELRGSTLSGNGSVTSGGGLYMETGTATLTNSTVSGNTVSSTSAGGGGLANISGTLTLASTTVTDNRAAGIGGGLLSLGSVAKPVVTRLARSLVAGNLVGATAEDCYANPAEPIVSQGDNLVGTGCPVGGTDLAFSGPLADTLALALADNGGPTRTHALPAGSPARDRIPLARCGVAADQRGIARPQGASCDVGAFEFAVAPPSPSPTPAPAPGMVSLNLTLRGGGSMQVSPAGGNGGFSYAPGTVVTLTPQFPGDLVFVGWTVDGRAAGWADPLTLTLDTGRAVEATFAPRQTFGDAGPDETGATEAIAQLAARTVIKGCDQEARPPRFCPTDPTLRAQMAVLIVRALGWGGENPTNPFTDRDGVDDELWRAIAILADHGVANGYGGGPYGTIDPVLNAQVISFITRAMVDAGHWTFATDDGTAYPNVAPDSGHRVDLATYVRYAGPVRGTASATDDFAGWDQPSSRAYFAFALWQALDSHFSVDRVP